MPPPLPPAEALRESVLRRAQRLDEIERTPGLVEVELELCRRSVEHFFFWWLWTYDPRLVPVPGVQAHMPFDLWEIQRELLSFIDARVRAREDGLVEKSRDMGFTYVCGGYALHKWRFEDGFKSSFASRDADLVDEIGAPDSIFEKIRAMYRALPRWLLPAGFNSRAHDNAMLLVNPANGNTISGEAGDEIGRGGRSTLKVLDEAAFYKRGIRVDASTSANTDTRIWGSTVNGMSDIFALKRHGGQLRPDQILRMHYDDDPRMTPERVAALKKNVLPHVWASEREIDYTASVEGICIPAKWVASAKALRGVLEQRGISVPPHPAGRAGLDVGAGKARSVYVSRFGCLVRTVRSWGNPDTTDTAITALDLAAAETFVVERKPAAPVACRVAVVNFDEPGVGKGVLAAMKRHKRPRLVTVPINTGVPPTETPWPDGVPASERYLNLKAELWATARERIKCSHELLLWLRWQERLAEDPTAKLFGDDGEDVSDPATFRHPVEECLLLPPDSAGPDAVQLSAQLSSVKWGKNEKGKFAMETKQAMARRGLASPDHADGLILTFDESGNPLTVSEQAMAWAKGRPR